MEKEQTKKPKEKKTITEYFNNLAIDRTRYPRLLLKLKHTLETMGITQVYYKKDLKSMDVHNELTLMIYPRTPSDEGSHFNQSYHGSSSPFYNKLKDLPTFNHNSIYYNEYFNSEGIPIKMKVGDGELEVGTYVKNRNLLVLYHGIFYFLNYTNSNKEEDNVGIYLFINTLKDFIIKNKVKTEDLTEVIKNRAIEVFKDEFKREISGNQRNIKQIEMDIISYNETIKKKFFDKEKNKRNILKMKDLLENLETNILKQVDEIKTLKFVKSTRLLLKGIKIDVGKIKIKDIYIGDFIIYITPRNIKFENVNPQDSSKRLSHPHISGREGSICFGNRKDLVYELLAKYDYKKLVYFLYLYLKSYNKNDKYNSIEYWGGDNDDF